MTKRATVLAFLLTCTMLDSAACVAADISHGQQIARRWCVSCHAVPGNQPQSTTEAPAFASIARRPDFDLNRLTAFLLNPHPKMPNMSLTRTEAADIAAYIGSLAQ